MVICYYAIILLCYTLVFSEVIYADFYAKILDWNFRLVDENSRILVVIFVSKLNLSFSFRFTNENYGIFVVVIVVFMTKINLLSSMKIFVSVVVDEKNTDTYAFYVHVYLLTPITISLLACSLPSPTNFMCILSKNSIPTLSAHRPQTAMSHRLCWYHHLYDEFINTAHQPWTSTCRPLQP